VQPVGDSLMVRTYERGVEGETLACGTGAVASGILASVRGLVAPPVTVRTSGGETLVIHFDPKRVDFGRSSSRGHLLVVRRKDLREAYRY